MPGKWRQRYLGKNLDCENSIWRPAYFRDFSRQIFSLAVKSEIVFLETVRLWDITDGTLSSLSRHLRVNFLVLTPLTCRQTENSQYPRHRFSTFKLWYFLLNTKFRTLDGKFSRWDQSKFQRKLGRYFKSRPKKS